MSRGEAISKALSRTEHNRWNVYHLKTEIEWEDSGNYPCYHVSFSYRDENGQEVRLCCFVDGETGEYLGEERVD